MFLLQGTVKVIATGSLDALRIDFVRKIYNRKRYMVVRRRAI